MMRINYFDKKYEDNSEAIANKYVIRGMTVSFVLMFLMWILNQLQIFVIDNATMTNAMRLTVIEYFAGVIVSHFLDLRKEWVKYFLLTWNFLIYTTIAALLTFHAYLVCVIPILHGSMYTSKRVLKWTYVMTVISIVVVVFVGYNVGLCDTNMVLLSGEPMAEYIGADNTWLLTKINDQVVYSLTLFFVVPRSVLCLAIALVCSGISRINRENVQRALKLTERVAIDEMTGLYNRNHYLEMLTNGYTDVNEIAVVFWDINELKETNDTKGHEAGDELICAVGGVIRQITDDDADAYRIGGDEFVMIIPGGTEESAVRKAEECEALLKKCELEASASVGYAYGCGKDILEIVREADQMMYLRKKESKRNSA